ncbi:nuclear factor 7, brain-like [Aplochiton taeniatus]
MGREDGEMKEKKEKWDQEKVENKNMKKKARARATDGDEEDERRDGERGMGKWKETRCAECEQNPSLFCVEDLQTFQAQQTEKQIKEEFQKLHQFLRKEEQSRLAALREEAEKKKKAVEEKMNRTRKEMCSLWLIIKASERNMAGDESTFLQVKDPDWSWPAVCKIWQNDRTPEKVCGPLIDVAKHLGNLRYAVWDKMKRVAPYTPVTLDPNTANAYLSLSPDLTSVKDQDEGGGGKDQNTVALPDTPERFSCCGEMLGSEGFSSGVHRWVVEVGGNTNWILGVATESVVRKQLVPACPESGLWGVSWRRGECEALESPSVPLSLPPSLPGGATRAPPTLRRVEVCVNCDGGEVSFRDAASGTHLYSYRPSFTERVFPYFSTACGLAPLRLCPEIDMSCYNAIFTSDHRPYITFEIIYHRVT